MVAGRGGGGDGQDWLQRHGGLQVVIKQPLYSVHRAFEWVVFKNQSDQDWKIAAEQAAGCSGKIQQAGSYSKWVLKVIAMLGESLVPEPAREFFNVVSAAVSIISFAFTWP